MPYAFEGGVATNHVDGSIEITGQQYQDALVAVTSGKEVTIDGGFALRDPRPSEHHVWADGAWVDETPEPEPHPELPVSPLTRRQLRLGLLANDITTASVDAAIAAIPDPMDRAVAEIEWADASTYERDHPLVEMVGSALGLTPEQIDAMWNEALSL